MSRSEFRVDRYRLLEAIGGRFKVAEPEVHEPKAVDDIGRFRMQRRRLRQLFDGPRRLAFLLVQDTEPAVRFRTARIGV